MASPLESTMNSTSHWFEEDSSLGHGAGVPSIPITLQPLFGPLDPASPQFPNDLSELLSGVEYRRLFPMIEDEDAAWLVEYLDNVIDILDRGHSQYKKCLHELARINTDRQMLQRSCTIGPQYFPRPDGSKVTIENTNIFLHRNIWILVIDEIHTYRNVSEGIAVLFDSTDTEPRNPKIQFGEISKWKWMTHPNVAPFLGVTLQPLRFISTKVPGTNLSDHIATHPDANRVKLLSAVVDGLSYLHHHDVLHGDLRVTNILVDDSGCPRITNLSIYNVFPGGEFGSERRYPEMWMWGGGVMISKESDVFALAVVMHETFGGEIESFDRVPPYLCVHSIPERSGHPGLTDKLWNFMVCCWDTDARKRPNVFMAREALYTPADENAASCPQEGVINEVLDITDQIASVALFGPIGVGKSFVARTILNHSRTKAKFGLDRYFLSWEELTNPPGRFLERLSDAIHTNASRLLSRLQSPPPLMVLLDGLDVILDPSTPESENTLAAIEEFGAYEHVCLVTTSRRYPNIPGFHRIEAPVPSESNARGIFYNNCSLERSSVVDNLIAALGFHPLSIALVATSVRESGWDEAALSKAWGAQKGTLQTNYYKRLEDAVEPMFHSPTIKRLGAAARDSLEAIAAFPHGVRECELERIFRRINGIGEVIEVLCEFSLVYRQDGFVKMILPLQFYFLESMIVLAQTEEIIRWGPDCMPAPGLLPVSTNRQAVRPSSTSREKARWVIRLPKWVKRRLLKLFGRRIMPPVQKNIQDHPELSGEDAVSTPMPADDTLSTYFECTSVVGDDVGESPAAPERQSMSGVAGYDI